MIEYFSLVAAAFAAVLALVALWQSALVRHEVKRFEEDIEARPTATGPRTPPTVVPGSVWHDSTVRDAPEWLRASLSTQYDLIQDLQREVAQLRAELIRSVVAHETPAAPIEESRQHTDAVSKQPRGHAVEIRDGEVIPSRALAAPGVLEFGDGDEPARLYLNDSVEIDHLALERWSTYFDFVEQEPYRRYRTLAPSRVAWNQSAERGTLLSRGKVEAI